MKATFLMVAVLAAAATAHAEDTLKTANIQRYYTPVKFDLIGAASIMPGESPLWHSYRQYHVSA